MQPTKFWKGHPYPMGATWRGNGVNFALFSDSATGVEVCFYDEPHGPEVGRVRLNERTDHCWHLFLPEIRPGQLYGFRVEGPYEPEAGRRYNPHKLLVDPYAKAIAGDIAWCDEVYGYRMGDPAQDLSFDERDSGPFVPKSVVIDPAFDWAGDRRPGREFAETVIYELHVRGFTKLWPAVPEELRGTYRGLASPPALAYLRGLGVTAVELLPVHHHLTNRILFDQGLTDFWGYNTLGFFAPHAGFSQSGDRGGQVVEFKEMVQALHAAGLEVILDVVYNHTVEGNELGPTLCFRGIDNWSYYKTDPQHPRHHRDTTGTGNALNVDRSRVLQLIMDSLRYWVLEMHVDGFRFDLATTLTRGGADGRQLSSFFDVVHQDPVISQVKLIAEPWDVGEDGYRVGHFPVLWAEWNGRYRDTLRQFWVGSEGNVRDLAYRLCGSADLYAAKSKSPTASINFITAHDGFTLRDLVSFNEKHNEANQEGNQDGDNAGYSWNCGVEGLDAPPAVQELRRRQQRNFFASLLLSQGVPMLRAGDEFGHTQHGNNNAYCQDNEVSWLNWEHDAEAARLARYVARLIQFRRDHAVFRQSKFLQGRAIRGSGVKDLTWLNADGREMQDTEWDSPYARMVGMLYRGDQLDIYTYFLERISDAIFVVYLNAYHEQLSIALPTGHAAGWTLCLDTADEEGFPREGPRHAPGSRYVSAPYSLQVFAGVPSQLQPPPPQNLEGDPAGY